MVEPHTCLNNEKYNVCPAPKRDMIKQRIFRCLRRNTEGITESQMVYELIHIRGIETNRTYISKIVKDMILNDEIDEIVKPEDERIIQMKRLLRLKPAKTQQNT
ncbi:MAG: hypothetical protein CVU81_01085 [Euryarchaeota archaeon HGW-Euryarchaeota-1]|nr:MAG: hypothetical protein CVU81_01085 [Euryarchaeota archaeon HGW-Euryarchaeota-1]